MVSHTRRYSEPILRWKKISTECLHVANMSELPRVLDSSNEHLALGSHRQQRQELVCWTS